MWWCLGVEALGFRWYACLLFIPQYPSRLNFPRGGKHAGRDEVENVASFYSKSSADRPIILPNRPLINRGSETGARQQKLI